MTDDHLPDNLAHWPIDPYALLGVNAGIDERGLKRAYAKLIRKFKPEHHPQEFARIRNAFEQVQSRLSWFAQFRTPEVDPSAEHETVTTDETAAGHADPLASPASPSDSSATSPSDPKRQDLSGEIPIGELDHLPIPHRVSHQQKLQDSIEMAWNDVIRGDWSSGYQQLRKLSEHPSATSELHLRLYWLQRLFPQVDPVRHHSSWLITALRRSHLKGPAWALYGSELDRHPSLVENSEHVLLIDSATWLGRLFELLEHRWRAATRRNRWDIIESDLNKIRGTVREQSIETWARILFRAIDFCAWSSQPMAKQFVQRSQCEIEELSELHFRLSHEFDRHDQLMEMQAQTPLDQIKLVTDDFMSLVRDTWTDLGDDLELRIRSMVGTWALDPQAALIMLTEIRIRANFAFHHVCVIISRINLGHSVRHAPNRAAMIRQTCQQFLMQRRDTPYLRLRIELVEFCVAHGIEVSEILKISQFFLETEMVRGTFDSLQIDVELEILVRGILVFWSA